MYVNKLDATYDKKKDSTCNVHNTSVVGYTPDHHLRRHHSSSSNFQLIYMYRLSPHLLGRLKLIIFLTSPYL